MKLSQLAPIIAATFMGLAGMNIPERAIASSPTAHDSKNVLKPGDRIRLTAPTLAVSWVIGRVVHADDTLLTIHDSAHQDSVRRFPRASVSRIERSEGHVLHPGGSALMGAGIGALIGLLPALAVPDNSGSARGMALVVGPAAGAALGAILGAVGGSIGPTERWRALPLDVRMACCGESTSLKMTAAVQWRF